MKCLFETFLSEIPIVRKWYLKGLPKGWSRKGLDAGDKPDLVEHPKHSFTKLVSDVVLDCRGREQGVVDCEQEGEEGVPRLTFHDLTLLCQLLNSSCVS